MKDPRAEAERWFRQAECDIPTRYPNGLPGGTPAEVYTEAEAELALHLAQRVLDRVAEVFDFRPVGEGDDD